MTLQLMPEITFKPAKLFIQKAYNEDGKQCFHWLIKGSQRSQWFGGYSRTKSDAMKDSGLCAEGLGLTLKSVKLS